MSNGQSAAEENANRVFDAEGAVIGSVLLDERCLDVIRPQLVPADMLHPTNKAILKAAYSLSDMNKPVDPVTISDYLQRRGTTIDNEYMLELLQVTPTATNAGVYANIVKRNSIRRQIKALGRQIAEDDELDPYVAMTELQKSVDAIAKSQMASIVDGVGIGTEFLTYRSKTADAGISPVISTGFTQLDRLLNGGFLNEGLYIIGARPAMGKTTFALALADNMARAGHPTLFISLEMSLEQIMAKRIARMTSIASNTVLTSMLTADEYTAVVSAVADLSERPLYFNRLNGVTVPQIGVMASAVKNIKCLFIDYLGLIRPSKKRKSRYEEMTEISGELKMLATRLKIPIVCLAQLNREVEGRTKKTPRMSDLRDTGAIEQDADGIIFLYRPDYYEDAPQTGGGLAVKLNVLLVKNRHGATGSVSMAMYPHNSKITAAKP